MPNTPHTVTLDPDGTPVALSLLDDPQKVVGYSLAVLCSADCGWTHDGLVMDPDDPAQVKTMLDLMTTVHAR